MQKMTKSGCLEWMNSLSDHDVKRIIGLVFTDKTGVPRKKSDDTAINYLVKQPIAEVDAVFANILNAVPVTTIAVGDDKVSSKISTTLPSAQACDTIGGDSVAHYKKIGPVPSGEEALREAEVVAEDIMCLAQLQALYRHTHIHFPGREQCHAMWLGQLYVEVR